MALFRSKPAASATSAATAQAGHAPASRTAAPVGLPVQVAELLFSKMSHDLASPAGAVTNGLELLEEEAGSGAMQDEALRMVRDSAQTVASRLKLYRLAYGTPGGAASLGEEEIRRILTAFYASNARLTVAVASLPAETEQTLKKLLLNLILCASDSLPRGGSLNVTVTDETLTVTATSADPARPPRAGVVVTGPKAPPPAELTPHTVQAWYTGWYAWKCKLKLTETLDGNVLTLTARKAG